MNTAPFVEYQATISDYLRNRAEVRLIILPFARVECKGCPFSDDILLIIHGTALCLSSRNVINIRKSTKKGDNRGTETDFH
jgi:hypothetical protein